jgi:hypothetical protein
MARRLRERTRSRRASPSLTSRHCLRPAPSSDAFAASAESFPRSSRAGEPPYAKARPRRDDRGAPSAKWRSTRSSCSGFEGDRGPPAQSLRLRHPTVRSIVPRPRGECSWLRARTWAELRRLCGSSPFRAAACTRSPSCCSGGAGARRPSSRCCCRRGGCRLAAMQLDRRQAAALAGGRKCAGRLRGPWDPAGRIRRIGVLGLVAWRCAGSCAGSAVPLGGGELSCSRVPGRTITGLERALHNRR